MTMRNVSRSNVLHGWRGLTLLSAVACAGLVHCGDPRATTAVPGGLEAGVQNGEGGGDDGSCHEEGDTRPCTAHHEAGCASGIQTCVAGTWSACRPDFDDEGLAKRDLSADVASPCGTDGSIPNTCDPHCNAVQPGEPDFGGGSMPTDWQAGSLGELPSEALAAGLPDDCDDDSDCQFDHYCDEEANDGRGECVAWTPGGYDPSCGAYDVTLGVSCEKQVPICNRGSKPVPVAALNAMQIQWKPPPPYLMDGCALGDPEGKCAIDASEDLDVGHCLDVACEVPADRVAYLDAGPGNSDECRCANNWSFTSDGACGAPACGADVSAVTEVKLALFLSLDISGSMAWDKSCPYDKSCSGTCSASNCSGVCNSSTECSTFKSDSAGCCWKARTAASSRWGAVHTALKAFVHDAESDGLGVVMKLWGSGTCQASACNAIDEFPDDGSCAHSPCTPDAAPLVDACAPFVSDVCSTFAREYCCGGNPKGSCAFTPCETNAGTLASGCGGSGTPIKTATTATCATKGYEGCCNGAPASGGNWGMNKAPCTATTTMTCRDGTGSTIACNSATAATAPVTSLTYAAYETAVATPSCISTWSASCVTTFREKFMAHNAGRDPCAKAWDAGCVAKYGALAGSTPGASCTYEAWDASCVATANAKGATCASTACNHPTIPSGCLSVEDCPLVLSSSTPDPAEDAIVAALDAVSPSGGTPSAIAVEGAGDFCIDYQAAHPDQRCAVVFVSDGQPSGCGDAAAVYAAAANAADHDVDVFAIGISGAGTDFMNTVAEEGDTGSAFFISPDNTAASDFLYALDTIRNQFACREQLPPDASLDTLAVTFHDGASRQAVDAVADVDACAGVAPTALAYYPVSDDEIALCPASCQTMEKHPGAVIEVVNDCGPPATPVTVTDEFTAGSACDDYPGTYPKWTVMFYRADVPRGSSIAVRARTRLTTGDAWRDFVDVVTITHEKEISDLSDPASLENPLDLDAFGTDLEIEMTTDVYGGAPAMLDYELQLSCEDIE